MGKPDPIQLRELARQAVLRLQQNGFAAFWAGGCVRDQIMGQLPKDYDIATNAKPDEVIRMFPGAETVGKSFGVVRAPLEGALFEIATFREDHGYADGRRPSAVSFTDPATDAMRRDFTINAVFFDPVSGQYHDYVGGRKDIEARLIRAVGDPCHRFAEDYLRMLRAARFAATLEFRIEPNTAAAIRALAGRLAQIAPERVREELNRTLCESRRPGSALRILDDLGILQVILPEVAAMKGQPQPPEFHPEGDVFTHTVRMLDLVEQPSVPLIYAVLLHDVGKPATASQDNTGRLRFHYHSSKGAEIARKILERLRFSNDEIEIIVHCVGNHMRFMDVPRMRRATLRRLVGEPSFEVELELHRLDCLASHGDLSTYEFLRKFQRELATEPVLPKPWINGNDVMQLGVPEGPQVGQWLQKAYDAQLEQRFADRAALLEWLKKEIEAARACQDADNAGQTARQSSIPPKCAQG